jgi:hypothetical protein
MRKRTTPLPQRYLPELRMFVPDARSEEVRRAVAEEVARLDPDDEREAMEWIEAVSEFDSDTPPTPRRRRKPRTS